MDNFEEISGSRGGRPARPIFSRLLPLALCGLYLAQCAWFIARQSFTYDEPHHIKAGLDAWRHARFDVTDGHPGLPRMYFTLPLLAGAARVEQVEENTATGFEPDAVVMARRVRAMQAMLGLALAVLLWRAARRLYSEGAANFALALFALSPALVAHFSVATTDAAGILMTFGVALAVARWRRIFAAGAARALGGETLWLGMLLGVLLVSKYYTPTLWLLGLAWVLTAPREGVPAVWNLHHWNWRHAAVIFAASFVVVWASFFFHVTHITLTRGAVRLDLKGWAEPLITKVASPVEASFSLPAVEYLAGVSAALDHGRRGHRSYFLGEVSSVGGWKTYFPVVILLKWPTVVLVLAVAAMALAVRGKFPWPREMLVIASFPAVFFIPAMLSKIRIGDRHILPVYPFVLLLLAGVWEAARNGPRRSTACALLLVLAALMAADTLRYAPDYLSWFNVAVAPEENWRLLADSSLDWGQGLLALRAWQEAHPDREILLAYYGNVAPEVYGIRYSPLAPGQRPRGIVVVSALHLAGRLLDDPQSYQWVLQHRRIAVLNHTLHVFEVD